MTDRVTVVGAGLAGCEAAHFLAKKGFKVRLVEMKPRAFTPAHESENFCELVCSNSLKGADPYSNACGLLKEEMRTLGSLTMEAADKTRVPAGGALAVDRESFSAYVTKRIREEGNIEVTCETAEKIPSGPCIICTGPLTQGPINGEIEKIAGAPLHFYDASAPIVSAESVDMERAFVSDRYGKGSGDYVNCPMSREEYYAFVDALLAADRAVLRDFEKSEIFEGCMPIEVLAARGRDTLRFANLKPAGLGREFAVLQLRRENVAGDCYNLVGCQTNLKFPEQKRVFSLVPALEHAEFLRYGVMHRNTYLDSPKCLDADFSLRSDPMIFFAGQMTGVEGYVESAASGMVAAANMSRRLEGKDPLIPGPETVMGALCRHISTPAKNFQPMNANFGLLPPLSEPVRGKKDRYRAMAERAIAAMKSYASNF